jgi:hypothetical protein
MISSTFRIDTFAIQRKQPIAELFAKRLWGLFYRVVSQLFLIFLCQETCPKIV